MTALARRPARDSRVHQIIEVINAQDDAALDRFGAWQPLADLSSRTRFESIDGDPDSVVFMEPNSFEAIASVYVTLVYGSPRDEETMSDEYIATIRGHLYDGEVMLDSIEVDTTPFYE